MFQTLGDVVTCVLVLAALLVVPYKLARVWLAPRVRRLAALFVMSRPAEETPRLADTEIEDGQPATTMLQDEGNSIAMTTTEYNALLFATKADALAAMVHAGKVGETEGIKLVFGVGPSSSNKTYQAARELLKARLARMQPDKFRLTPEQEKFRERLGLSNRQNT